MLLRVGVFARCYFYISVIYFLCLNLVPTPNPYVYSQRHKWEVWEAFGGDRSIAALLVFVLILCAGIILGWFIKKRKRAGSALDSLYIDIYMTIFFFSFPTINSKYIIYTHKVDIGFNEITPWGYGIIAFFVKKVDMQADSTEVGYRSYIKNFFNSDIFTQMFQEKWFFIQFVSLVMAIVFTVICERYLQNLNSDKNSNIC